MSDKGYKFTWIKLWLFQNYIPEIDAFPKPTIILSLFFDEEAITTEGGLFNFPSVPCWSFIFVLPTLCSNTSIMIKNYTISIHYTWNKI